MKVFISFDSKDSQLAYALRDKLKENSITGYLFDLDQKYDSTLYSKITSAINDSQALVAIITKDMHSPSVHEEIGYAIASKKSLIIMLEQDANDGVLSHEREKELFTKEDFENSCKRIIKYLQKLPQTTTKISEQSSRSFLEKRNLLNESSENFAKNKNSEKLQTSEYLEDKTPLVLFSTCPENLLDDVPVNSIEFEEWLGEFRAMKVDDVKIPFLRGSKKIGLGVSTYFYEHSSHYNRYLEFNSNGFVEQGFTNALIYPLGRKELSNTPLLLNLCWLTGTFWAFLLFCKEYYKYIKYDGKIEIFLSIKDANELMLMGFGGKSGEHSVWAEPWRGWDMEKPQTDKDNILLKQKLDLNSLTEEEIKKIVRNISDKIANAYGLDSAMCYNMDGTINRVLLSYFR